MSRKQIAVAITYCGNHLRPQDYWHIISYIYHCSAPCGGHQCRRGRAV